MKIDEIVDLQIRAYEEGDLETFLSFYSDTLKVYKDRRLLFDSFDQFKLHYAKSFMDNPNHKVKIQNRILLSNKVIDHERVTGRGDGVDIEAVVIYTLENSKIVEVDFIS